MVAAPDPAAAAPLAALPCQPGRQRQVSGCLCKNNRTRVKNHAVGVPSWLSVPFFFRLFSLSQETRKVLAVRGWRAAEGYGSPPVTRIWELCLQTQYFRNRQHREAKARSLAVTSPCCFTAGENCGAEEPRPEPGAFAVVIPPPDKSIYLSGSREKDVYPSCSHSESSGWAL